MAMSTNRTSQSLNTILSPKFADFGLVWRDDGCWVEPNDTTIRRIVRFARLKGDSAVIEWGLSLNFVPTLSGLRLVYHRTWRAARLDVFESPRSYRQSFSGAVSFERIDCRDGFLDGSLAQYFSTIAPELVDWFDRVRSIEGVGQELERQVQSPDSVYRIHHPSPSFVLAFVKAARGDMAGAKSSLEDALGGSTNVEQAAKLRSALAKLGLEETEHPVNSRFR
jgi:hypothetical protein